MVVIRLLDSPPRWFLLSMFFSNPGNGGGFAAEAKGSSNGNGLFSSGWGGSGVWAGTSVDAGKVAIAVTAMAGLALAATIIYSRSGSVKSPWSRRRRTNALAPQQWESLFSPDGKLRDGGVKFLKKVRSGGVDPSIRPEVWPFLLGVYSLNSSKSERNAIRRRNRREYENLRRTCQRLAKKINGSFKKPKEVSSGHSEDGGIFNENEDSAVPEDVVSGRQSISIDETSPGNLEIELQGDQYTLHSKPCMEPEEEDEGSSITHVDAYAADSESSGSESSAEESEKTQLLRPTEGDEEIDPKVSQSDLFDGRSTKAQSAEDITTWQRIIRLDAIRANAEWVIYSPSQAAVSEEKALELAEAVGLKDYDHLEPCRIFHAARLVAILEAYAVYDAEIGYCQGMSDLLSPIIAVMEEDYEAFWCFVGFMRKARHNFRLDEVGIRRQLNIVSKIIKSKDSQLYRHLEKLQAEDCFFVYRMVVVLFRRELDFEQTLCLWEVMWADQAAIRAGIGKSAWGRVRMRAPPTDDLLLYAIAACVLQRRKLIIERYSSMDEILRECNSMVGQLDVWKLLDDAHDLVVTLHDKI